MRLKKIFLCIVLCFVFGSAYAENIAEIPCTSCGNSNDDRASQTLNLLRDFNAMYNLGHGWKPGDTVTVVGGDGSRGVYKKYNQYLTIQYGCIEGCGPGDSYPGFIPPVTGGYSGGGETNYPIGGSYGGMTIVGYRVNVITGYACVQGVCTSTTIYEYEPIWATHYASQEP